MNGDGVARAANAAGIPPFIACLYSLHCGTHETEEGATYPHACKMKMIGRFYSAIELCYFGLFNTLKR